MGADFSRVRLNPLLDYAGVELQQGRVLLDADFNELVGDRRPSLARLEQRRPRAARRYRPPRPTPSRSASRAARCRSARAASMSTACWRRTMARNPTTPAKRVFDGLLAESQFADPIPYTAQPYLPAPPALPTAGRHLVYLDVWDREVTHLEQPDLVESAVGVDTTSRLQTVWQVRVLDGDAGTATTCAAARRRHPRLERADRALHGRAHDRHLRRCPGRRPLRAAADRRLSRPREPALPRRNPRSRPARRRAPPSSGRARTPASAAASPASFPATELELQTLGRDDVLRFNTGDWVEIIDDVREFSQARGENAAHHRERGDAAHQLHAGVAGRRCCRRRFPTVRCRAMRNMRVRRWDQKRTGVPDRCKRHIRCRCRTSMPRDRPA